MDKGAPARSGLLGPVRYNAEYFRKNILSKKNNSSTEIMITPAQCRAARGLLNWSQQKLAEEARVSRATVAHYETESANLQANNILSLQHVLEEAGIEFISTNGGGPGVRLRRPV